MLNKVKLVLILSLFVICITNLQAQVDPPAGYTVYYGLKMYNEGDYPSADSVNDNLINIDQAIKDRAIGLDSFRTAFTGLHEMPSGNLKSTVYARGQGFLFDTEFNFGLFQGIPFNLMTQGAKRIIINQYGVVTIGTVDSVGSRPLYSGDLFVKDEINLQGEYSSSFKFRQDSDQNWNFYPLASSEIIFGNTDATTWFTVNAGGYKTQGTPGFLASALGSVTASGLWLAEGEGGTVDRQLSTVTLTINGVTRNFLVTQTP